MLKMTERHPCARSLIFMCTGICVYGAHWPRPSPLQSFYFVHKEDRGNTSGEDYRGDGGEISVCSKSKRSPTVDSPPPPPFSSRPSGPRGREEVATNERKQGHAFPLGDRNQRRLNRPRGGEGNRDRTRRCLRVVPPHLIWSTDVFLCLFWREWTAWRCRSSQMNRRNQSVLQRVQASYSSCINLLFLFIYFTFYLFQFWCCWIPPVGINNSLISSDTILFLWLIRLQRPLTVAPEAGWSSEWLD